MHHVLLALSAKKSFEDADAALQKKLDRCFSLLARDPRHHNNIKPLRGRFAGYLRFRLGEYRVVYRIDDASSQVIVVDIAHRKDVYE